VETRLVFLPDFSGLLRDGDLESTSKYGWGNIAAMEDSAFKLCPSCKVDRIISFETETKCVGVKTVTINEPFFQGHFPGHPVMPGVMQVEAMAQVASILLFKLAKATSRIGYFMSADGVKFRKPVLPGDTNFIHAELTKSRGERLAKSKCHCVVNDTVVSEGELMFTFLDQ
jgi:UDP-3-O-[3-hydroxymyristoyl] N-acetylglucosamine deacetylase/3-hydroxyacyl-[acyl-carrier-protein] dehydratase